MYAISYCVNPSVSLLAVVVCGPGAGAASAAESNVTDNGTSCSDSQNENAQIAVYAVARRKNNAELNSFDMSMHCSLLLMILLIIFVKYFLVISCAWLRLL